MTALTPTTPGLRPRRTRRRTSRRSSWPAAERAAAVVVAADVVTAAVVAVLVMQVGVLAGACGVGWAILLRVLAPHEAMPTPRAREVWRGAAVLVVGCWVAGPAIPVAPSRLVAAVGAVVVVSAAVRAIVGRHAGRLRVLVVGSTSALLPPGDLVTAARGRLVVAGACAARSGEVSAWLDGPRRDEIDAVLALPDLTGRALRRVAWELEAAGVPLLVATGLDDVAPTRVDPLGVGGVGLMHVRPAPRRGWRGLVKQVVERTLALLALVACAPLFATVALAIRLDSPGPALFRQDRVGRGGRRFTMLKFRTMVADAEQRRAELESESDGPLFKVRRDPRVTRVGRVLRRYSLDELPQLLNVVRGEMALVGPRPALPAEVEAYDEDPLRRLAVAPGVTGLWQVSGRSDLPWSEAVRLDLEYVDNWSLGLDLAIVVRTVGAVLRHQGAY